MSVARRHRFQHIITTWARRAGAFLRLSDEAVAPLLDIIRRPAIAHAFFMSALVKLSDWDNALYLAEHEYPVSWMNHVTAAYLGVSVEIIGGVLLSLGLMTRFAALALLILTIIMQYAYEPINAQVFWIIILGYWVIMGGGLKSIDFLLRGLKDSALPFATSLSTLFIWLRHTAGPWYFLFIRVWIAGVLYVAGHTAMESMSLHGSLHFLQYQPQFSVLRISEPSVWLSLVCGVGAISLAFGLATRFWALLALVVIAGGTMQHIHASEVQMAEFFYWIMLLSILFFSGPNKISLDHLVRRSLGRLFPEFSGEFPMIHEAMPHVVIVGGGFGGIAAGKMLRTTACRVTLIDKHNYHLFQPLLYQVATASLSPADIATPIRSLFRDQQNIRVILGEVTAVDAPKRMVVCEGGKTLKYDYLVLATGARHSYFGNDAWAEFAPGMKRVEDAIAVRGKLLKAFERAENSDNAAEREALLSFVIVGGGPTGVELAGALAELAHQGMGQEFRNIDPSTARIYLIEAGPRLLGVMPEGVSGYTQEALEKLGVTVMTGARVKTIDAEGVSVNGIRIASSNVIWAAGVQASPAAKWLGAEADRAGRIKVNRNLTIVGDDRIYAIGDTAWAEVWNGKPMPGLAPAAKQSGQFVARHIRARIEGSTPAEAFAYQHYGSLATIGRKAAVADFGHLRIKGVIAWWFWGLVHIAFLSNMQSRVAVMIKWFWAYLTFRRSTRLITEAIN
jgi:NADH dehydrogenase/putative oxidoreductase